MKKTVIIIPVLIICLLSTLFVFAEDSASLSGYSDAVINNVFSVDFVCGEDLTNGVEGTVNYDNSLLEFVSVTTALDGWCAESGNDGRIVVWNDTMDFEPVEKGTKIFSVQFKFKEGVANHSADTIYFVDGLDNNDNEINVNSIVTVKWITGDGNNDGHVNSTDRILLSRYLAEWEGFSEPYNTDIDNDGTVSQRDRVILSRYLAGWDEYNKYFE